MFRFALASVVASEVVHCPSFRKLLVSPDTVAVSHGTLEAATQLDERVIRFVF